MPDDIPTDAEQGGEELLCLRESTAPPGPGRISSGLCHGKDSAKGFGDFFAVIDTIGGDAQGEGADGGNGGIAGCAIGHDARHEFDVGPPATVFLTPDEDRNGFYGDGFHRSSVSIIVPERNGRR